MLCFAIFFLGLSRMVAKSVFNIINPYIAGFYIFLFAEIFFVSINFNLKKNIKFKLLCKNNIYSIFLFNIISLGAWFDPLYPLKYISSTLASCIITSCTPFLSIIFLKTYSKKTFNLIEWINYGVLFILGFLFLLYVSMVNKNFYLFFWLFFSSLCLSCVGIFAKKMYNFGFSALESLMLRFLLTTIITGLIACCDNNVIIDFKIIIVLICISIIYIIIPSYLIQKSAQYVSSFSISLFFPFIPTTVFILEKISSSNNISLNNDLEILFLMASTCMAFFGAYYCYKKEFIVCNNK
jgi:hypothetical protein